MPEFYFYAPIAACSSFPLGVLRVTIISTWCSRILKMRESRALREARVTVIRSIERPCRRAQPVRRVITSGMRLEELVLTSAAVAGTPGRLDKISKLADLFKRVPPDDLPTAI